MNSNYCVHMNSIQSAIQDLSFAGQLLRGHAIKWMERKRQGALSLRSRPVQLKLDI